MAKMAYGGFDPQSKHIGNDGWENLETVMHFLEDGEAIPPDLASWLGQAIKYANGDTDELLRRLGLSRDVGRTASDEWLKWGRRLHVEEARGVKTGDAIGVVLKEYAAANDGEEPSPSTVQRWRDKYRKALVEAGNP